MAHVLKQCRHGGARGRRWRAVQGRAQGAARQYATQGPGRRAATPRVLRRPPVRPRPPTQPAARAAPPPLCSALHLIGLEQAHADLHAPPLPVGHAVQPPAQINVQQPDEPAATRVGGASTARGMQRVQLLAGCAQRRVVRLGPPGPGGVCGASLGERGWARRPPPSTLLPAANPLHLSRRAGSTPSTPKIMAPAAMSPCIATLLPANAMSRRH